MLLSFLIKRKEKTTSGPLYATSVFIRRIIFLFVISQSVTPS